VHIGLVVWLGIEIGRIPLQGTLLWFFLIALSATYLLVLLSFGFGVRRLGRLWRPLLVLGTSYILIAFGRDFVLGAFDSRTQHVTYAAQYVPFALLSLVAIPLRLAAFRLRHRWVEETTSTTEVPTFFGPPDSPLFGVLHLPADNQVRGGVLICGSLGKEGMDSARLHRNLADGLARRGFGVLRFDYFGTGDSAYAQGRDDAVPNWVASVGHAVAYLTTIGAEPTTAIGIRAGCLILQEYLTGSHPIERVAYLDPAGTGRRYLREHAALYKLAVGEDATAPGEVAVIGARFSEPAAAEFAVLRMSADPVSAHHVDNVLVVGRPGETDKNLTALASSAGVDSIVTGGLPQCARPQEIYLPVPNQAVDSIIGWIDEKGPAGTRRAAPRYLTTATMPAEAPDGADVVERIERLQPHGLFVIRTMPRSPAPVPTKTVLFFVTAKDLHVGPAREWVELSRRVATAGSQALRWDPAGLGLSGRINRDPWRNVYFKADIVDAITVARHACHDPSELEVVGICSGSWYAAHAARTIGVRSAILINVMVWNWRVISTVPSQWYLRREALDANAAGGTDGGVVAESRTARLKDRLNPARDRAKSLLHKNFPRSVLRLLGWVGLVWVPDLVLSALAGRGTDVTLIASPADADELIAKDGLAALDRLQASAHPPRLIATPTGDHSAHHPAILAAIRAAVLLPATSECPPEHMSVSNTATE
jgi:hypothetical protein